VRIDIVTVFPEMVEAALDHSIVKRARERGLVTINVVNLRDFTTDRHRTTDDIPYGGGGGMVMKIEPIARALEFLIDEPSADAPGSEGLLQRPPPKVAATTENVTVSSGVPSAKRDAVNVSLGIIKRPRIVLTDPRGPRFDQATARMWAGEPHLILLCGHYEGVDERVRQHLVSDEVSIGDYILTGGELPALIIVDALTRLQPGALGDERAPEKDTFADDLLEYPHYTRPREFRGWPAPEILLCGHHARIERWRRWHQLRATRERRPDLFARLKLSAKDLALLEADEPTAPADLKPSRRDVRTALVGDGPPPGVETMSTPTVDETVHDNEKHEVTDGSGTANHT
jgi:tRNA (guanine37-N1)-methyltransferase